MEFSSRQLRAFHLAAQHGSFARAADVLFITPSGLSVLIKELERQVGFRLFDRTTRRLVLTAQGKALLEVSQPSLQSIDLAALQLENAAKDKNKRLLIGTTPWMAAHVLPVAIRRYREAQPNLQIRLFDGSLGSITKRIETGKLDVGFGLFDDLTSVRSESLFRFALVLIRPDGVGGLNKRLVRWTDLKDQTLISLTPNYPHQHLIDQQLKKAGVETKKGQTVNLMDTQIGLVEAGEGMAVIPSFGLFACRDRMVVASDLGSPTINVDFRQITKAGTKLPIEAADFCTYLKGYIERWAGEIPKARAR
jgi:DNA-binding transcriptional LysR family regulator